MLDAKRIQSLPEMREPVLTVYLNINPGDGRNQGSPPGYMIWLKSRARVLGERLPRREQRDLRAQLKRVECFLKTGRPSSRGMAIFAGPTTWEEIPLQVRVEDELHWGRPSLNQLMWLLDEHQPSGLVVVDRSGARFVRFRLGEAEELATEKLAIDVSDWRDKHMAAPARPGVQKTRGSQRDVFQQSLEAQFARLYRKAADRIRRWIEKEQLCPVLVAGSGDVVERIWRELPAAVRDRAAVVKNDMSDLSLADLHARIEPELVRWKRAHELDLVARLVSAGNSRRAAVGIDETLQQLQGGKVRALVVAGGLGGKLFQCTACGWTDRSADRVCSTCGGERRAVALRAALPELARKFSVQVEVVSGEAGPKLREAGGLGAWLR